MRFMLATALGCALVAAQPAFAAETYLTGFTKTANISNNLNRNFPNTGGTTAGSVNGVPNASFLYNPVPGQNGNLADVDVNYLLTSDAVGRDYLEISNAGGAVTLATNVANASAVYFLVSAYFGTSVNVTLTGTGGATRTFTNIAIPDFNGGGDRDTIAGDVSFETIFRVNSVGGGGSGNSENGAVGNYYLYQLGLQLGSGFAGQGLATATITANAANPLLFGATVISADAPPATGGNVPEPATWATMMLGFGLVGAAVRRRGARAVTA